MLAILTWVLCRPQRVTEGATRTTVQDALLALHPNDFNAASCCQPLLLASRNCAFQAFDNERWRASLACWPQQRSDGRTISRTLNTNGGHAEATRSLGLEMKASSHGSRFSSPARGPYKKAGQTGPGETGRLLIWTGITLILAVSLLAAWYCITTRNEVQRLSALLLAQGIVNLLFSSASSS